MRLSIRVPATTANLGPGFDALGMALDLFNEVEVATLDGPGPDELSVEGEGARSLPRDGRHLLLSTARNYAAREGFFLPRLRVTCNNRVPLARGLGSSAATIVAGLLLAARLAGASDAGVLAEATRLEGHPDNVAPAIMGGLVASCVGETVQWCPLQVHSCWQVAVAIPAFKLRTAEARQVLPAQVPFNDAVFNLSRVATLLPALQAGRGDWLEQACQDRLHQPYRQRLVPGFDAVRRAALQAGARGFFLSGAGPTVAAWVDTREADPQQICATMERAFAEHEVNARGLVLTPCATGAQVAQS